MSRRTRVKICGITRIEDAQLAVELGADAIGFVLWPESPRVVNPFQARAISRALPPFVARVGVFVNALASDVGAQAAMIGLDAVQLHGDERVEDFPAGSYRVLRAVTLGDEQAVESAAGLPDEVLPLVEGDAGAQRGGTGRLANWDRAAVLASRRLIVLAGGLTSANVGDAIRRVRPWAVDVSSGVETSPGIKSRERMREFFSAVADANSEGA